MSRSYKKHGFSSFASYSSDKPSRIIYHRNERRKIKKLLNQVSIEDCYLPAMDADLGYVWDNDMCMVCKDCDEEAFAYCENLSDYMDEDWHVEPNYCFNRNGCGVFISENNPIDKIITKGIDYSVKYSDRWSWASDGGQYWTADISKLRRRFDTEVFGIFYGTRYYRRGNGTTIWDEYLYFRNASHNKKHKVWHVYTNWKGEKSGYWITGPQQASGDWGLMEFLWYRKLIPTTFWGPKDLIEWLAAHEEEILLKWFKMRLLRK